jgi:hypothetical protein
LSEFVIDDSRVLKLKLKLRGDAQQRTTLYVGSIAALAGAAH